MRPSTRLLCWYCLLAALVSITLTSSRSSPQPSMSNLVHDSDYWPTGGWRISTPEEQGMDSELLAKMFEHIDQKHINLHSVLIVRNGYIVAEAYFHPYTADTPHQIASVTKSVIDILLGIAIDRGSIRGVDQPLLDFFPGRSIANVDARKQAITLEHLLTMTSGLDCKDRSGTDEQMQQSSGWVQYILDLPMAHVPGTQFSYCSGGPHLLSAVLEKATGLKTRDFANVRLFTPLGIRAASDIEWGSDPQGYTLGGYGLYLTPRNMAKLGYLYLKQGQWAGQQIVPSQWVTASLTTHSIWTDEGRRDYGYLWWLYPAHSYYSMMGMAGQQVHILPKRHMVVVFTAAINPSDEKVLDPLLTDFIMPAAQSDSPLGNNPDGAARLAARIRSVEQPKQPVAPLPETAQQISGKQYVMDDNPAGFETIGFTFQPDAAEATITFTTGDGSRTLPIGLDNLYRATQREIGSGLLRGHWVNSDTFVLEDLRLGEWMELEYRIKFSETEMNVTAYHKVLGGTPLKLHGALKP